MRDWLIVTKGENPVDRARINRDREYVVARQEYAAQLAADGETYRQIAVRLGVSIGRAGEILRYGRLRANPAPAWVDDE